MQRKMRAQRVTSDGKRLVNTAIKVRATRDDIALGSNHFQRAEVGDNLTDFIRNWLAVDERAMTTGALMPVLVAIVLTVAVHRSLCMILMPVRPARTCLGRRCRFGAAISFTRMRVMYAASRSSMP